MIKRIFVAAMLASGILFTANAQSTSDAKTVENGKKGTGEKAEVEKIKDVPVPEAPKVDSGSTATQKPVFKKHKRKVSESKSKVWPKIVYYIPNRLIDVTDIFTISGGFGPEFSLYTRCTNYIQFGGASGEKYYLTKGFHRQYGGAKFEGSNFGLFPVSTDSVFIDDTFGTVVSTTYEKKDFNIPSFFNDYYTEKTADFWATEVRAGWLLNFSVGVHPVEIFDIVTGIFLIDIMDDDFEDSELVSVK